MSHNCPLCGASDAAFYYSDKKREYHQCTNCDLVFVPPQFHLTPQLEKAEYDKHENSLDDEGYLNFLKRAASPLIDYLDRQIKDHALTKSQLIGLDFGCGPAPALAHFISEQGYRTELYDLYYHSKKGALAKQYDFVTCTEVVEHFNSPQQGIEQLFSLVNPSGVLVIMTKLVLSQERFKNWHYKNDPTHVSFFSQKTFEYLASQYNRSVEFIGNDVIFFKPSLR